MLNLSELFEKHEEEFLEFDHIANPKHPTPDICAFLMLDEICPATYSGSGKVCDIISGAEHDQIYLATDTEKFAEKATEEQVIDLIRCGVMYEEEFESFAMYV